MREAIEKEEAAKEVLTSADEIVNEPEHETFGVADEDLSSICEEMMWKEMIRVLTKSYHTESEKKVYKTLRHAFIKIARKNN
jgi:hypothetical protein